MPAVLEWNAALPTTLASLHPRCGSFPWHTSALVEVCRQRLGRGVSGQVLVVRRCAKAPRLSGPLVPSGKSAHSQLGYLTPTAVDESQIGRASCRERV